MLCIVCSQSWWVAVICAVVHCIADALRVIPRKSSRVRRHGSKCDDSQCMFLTDSITGWQLSMCDSSLKKSLYWYVWCVTFFSWDSLYATLRSTSNTFSKLEFTTAPPEAAFKFLNHPPPVHATPPISLEVVPVSSFVSSSRRRRLRTRVASQTGYTSSPHRRTSHPLKKRLNTREPPERSLLNWGTTLVSVARLRSRIYRWPWCHLTLQHRVRLVARRSQAACRSCQKKIERSVLRPRSRCLSTGSHSGGRSRCAKPLACTDYQSRLCTDISRQVVGSSRPLVDEARRSECACRRLRNVTLPFSLTMTVLPATRSRLVIQLHIPPRRHLCMRRCRCWGRLTIGTDVFYGHSSANSLTLGIM